MSVSVTTEPKGYGTIGITWARSPLGFTMTLGIWRWKLMCHWRDREMEHLLRAEAKRLEELTNDGRSAV